MTDYAQMDFDRLLGTEGFSETMLKNHFTLYDGYVTNVNRIAGILDMMAEKGESGTPEYNELKRRFGWEFNGMRLHELYFGNMVRGGSKPDVSGRLARHISKAYGRWETWESDFRGTGAVRGIGWAILYHDQVSGRLFNVWVNEHDMGHLAGCWPLLVLDVFEHAYIGDYGIERTEYIEAFMNAVDWGVVEDRFTAVRGA